MPYTPNNPLVPGDPYSYDLKWMVSELKKLTSNYAGLNNEILDIKAYLSTLDVESFVNAKIDEMYNDGDFTSILQGLVDTYIADTDLRLDTIESDIVDISAKILTLKHAMPFRNDAPAFPLEVIKMYVNGISGDEYQVQGMCATYNSNDSIKNIYVFCDIVGGAGSRLYKITAGSRTDGSGWSYSYTDNVPAVHGSTISIVEDDNKILIANESGTGSFYEYDIITDSFALIDVSGISNTPILGIVYDSESETFLMCADNNNKMYVLDKSYNLIRSYAHKITYDTSSYLYQSFDYQNGLEYRTFNTPDHRSNGILIYDTLSGELLKTIDIHSLYGELESMSIRNGVALLAFNNVYWDYNNIGMHMIAEAYIGGPVNANFLLNVQQKINCGYPFVSLLNNGNTIGIPNYRYQNTHSNSELCRYVGVGTAANPIKSGLVIAAMLLLSKKYYPFSKLTITLSGASTNTDDNGIYMYNATGMDIVIDGNSQELCLLTVNGANTIELKALTLNANGASRRYNDGRMDLRDNNNLIIRTACTAPIILLIDNFRALLYQALTGTGTTNSESYRNIYMPGSKARFTAAHFASNGDISS